MNSRLYELEDLKYKVDGPDLEDEEEEVLPHAPPPPKKTKAETKIEQFEELIKSIISVGLVTHR